MRKTSILIHGWWGAGKSWLAASAPGPRLILDTEGMAWGQPHPSVLWNPLSESLADIEINDPDTSVVVDVTKWAHVEAVMPWLESGQHPFETVIFDSISHIQDQLKETVQTNPLKEDSPTYDPNRVFADHAWGRLLENLLYMSRKLLYLTRPSANKTIHVVLVSGSNMESIPITALLQGGYRKKLPGMVKMMGYLTSEIQNGEECRELQIVQNQFVVAKCNEDSVKRKWGSVIQSPDLTEIFNTALENG